MRCYTNVESEATFYFKWSLEISYLIVSDEWIHLLIKKIGNNFFTIHIIAFQKGENIFKNENHQ